MFTLYDRAVVVDRPKYATSVILQIFMIFMALSGLDDRHFRQFLLMDLHQSDGQLSRGFWQNNL